MDTVAFVLQMWNSGRTALVLVLTSFQYKKAVKFNSFLPIENPTGTETVSKGLGPAEEDIKEIPIIEKPTPTTGTVSLGAKTNETKIFDEPDQGLSFRLSIIFAIVGLSLALGVLMYRKMFGKLPILSRPLHGTENG